METEKISNENKSISQKEYEYAESLNLPRQNLPIEWPRKVDSLCPTCLKHLEAEIYEENNEVFMKKTCDEHGEVKERLSDDAWFFKRNELLTFGDGWGQSKPQVTGATKCPESCGLCNMHIGSPCLVNIDLTNRCNLNCPICFANAAESGYVYDLSFEQVRKIVKNLRSNSPVPPPALQLSGGEPTLRDDLPDILKMARDEGFVHIEVNTNGVRFANDMDFFKRNCDAGLDTIYLQFDGLSNDIYEKTSY